jgi:hypothetical protein
LASFLQQQPIPDGVPLLLKNRSPGAAEQWNFFGLSSVNIETFYIAKRLHSALGHISPLEFEKLLMEKENQKK